MGVSTGVSTKPAHAWHMLGTLLTLFYRFVIAAISPAIVVPTTLALKEKGYGIIKGEFI